MVKKSSAKKIKLKEWTDLLGTQDPQLMGRLKMNPSYSNKDHFNLTRTLKHFKNDFSVTDMDVFKEFAADMSCGLFQELNPEIGSNPDNDLYIFRSYYHFIIGCLILFQFDENQKKIDQAESTRQIKDIMSQDTEKTATIEYLCEEYKNCEKLVTLAEDNLPYDFIRFALVQLATYHWWYHSIRDVFVYNFKVFEENQRKTLIPPRQYLAEANELNGPNESSGKIISFFPADDDYAEHVRCVIRREEGSKEVLATYFKLSLDNFGNLRQ